MTLPEPVLTSITAELRRMEEDCTHSFKSHYNASDRWAGWHYKLSIPAIILSAAAGTAFFKDYGVVAGAMSTGVAIITALVTFLKPSERSSEHKNAGSQYLTLRNQSRLFREVEMKRTVDEETAVKALQALITRRDELNQASPSFSDADRRKARSGIEEGEATHIVDKEPKV